MCSDFRCSQCEHSVLTGILPNGVMEYACCTGDELVPYFYYDINPERVANCIDFKPVNSRVARVKSNHLQHDGSFYEFDQY